MRLRFLLRPNWLALTVVVFGFATLCYTLLAPWQFGRNAQREAQNASVQASLAAEPKPLAQVLPGTAAPTQASEWDRVRITGSYLPNAEVIARLRTVLGEPAFEVLAPFRTSGGQVIVVDRGYLRPNDKTQVPDHPAPPAGQQELVARVRADEMDPKHRDAFADASTAGRIHSYSINSQVVGSARDLAIRPGYFQLDPNQPGGLGTLPLPSLSAGPFFSYALQWIAFGTMAILGWLYFTVRELRPGGALTTAPGKRPRKSVAQILAEDEQERDAIEQEPADSQHAGRRYEG